MPQGICRKCFTADAQLGDGLCQFHHDLTNYGRAWADRDANKCTPPPKLLKTECCECCAPYKQPGWIVNANQWIRCPQCNPS